MVAKLNLLEMSDEKGLFARNSKKRSLNNYADGSSLKTDD